MKTNELFQYFKNQLNKLSNNIEYKEIISDVDTEDEEFFFYIQNDFNVCFYVFYDDWGMGLGLLNRMKNNANIWYFEDFEISEELKQYEFMLKIMIDIVLGKRLFYEVSEGEFGIYFKYYKGLKWEISVIDKNRLSIYEINEKHN